MKRSIALLVIAVFVAIGASGSYNEAGAGKLPTCCQMFKVVDSNGNPVAGCTLIVSPCTSTLCTCTTGNTGTCTICNLVPGTTYTVKAHCNGGGSTTFVACTSVIVTIHVQ
jgi:hypothetical protein